VLFLLLYVDNALIASQYKTELNEKLSRVFNMKALGPARQILGMDIQRDQMVGILCLYCDNRSTFTNCFQSVFHDRTKHIEINCHIIHEKVNIGLIKLLPISSSL